MRRIALTFLFWALAATSLSRAAESATSNISETSAVPAGEIIQCRLSGSAIYPGTERDYWIYVPAAYRGDRPACLYLDMDCIHYDAPAVFDRMIAGGELPVIIGVFMASGAVHDEQGNPVRFNRSNEFDRIDERFADFVERELLPDVERRTTADQKHGSRIVRIGTDGALRTIGDAPEGGERLALFPNHEMLLSSRSHSDWIDNYVVRRDGSLDCRQEWYRLHNIYADHLRPRGNMQCDRQGNLYVATPTGIQVCDHNGRVRAILQPGTRGVTSLGFAGPDHRTLCALVGGKLLVRHMKAAGTTPDMAAAEVATQGAG